MSSRYDRPDQRAVATTTARAPELPDPALADMLELVEGLDALVATGKRLPIYPGRVLVNVEDYTALADLLRRALPVEIQQARRVVQERQQILLDAQTEAEKIISVAKERAEYLISQKGLIAEARSRGEDVLRKSQEDQRRGTAQIDRYALRRFEETESAIHVALTTIQDALGKIEEAKVQLSRADAS